jgi:hypothetical protein
MSNKIHQTRGSTQVLAKAKQTYLELKLLIITDFHFNYVWAFFLG